MKLCSFAQATDSVRTYYVLARLQSMDQWWHWMVFCGVSLGVVVLIGLLYMRDTVELPRGKRWLLLALRVLAFVGLLAFFLDLEKRSERKLVKNSRLVLLIDTSQSMGLSGSHSSTPEGTRRIDQVVAELDTGTLLEDLRKKHDMVVYRFDQTSRPIQVASFAQQVVLDQSRAGATLSSRNFTASLGEARVLTTVGVVVLLIALGCALSHWIFAKWVVSGEGQSWALLISTMAVIIAAVTLAVSNLRNPNVTFAAMWGTSPKVEADQRTGEDAPSPPENDPPTAQETPIDWSSRLSPRGTETRLGDALRFLIEKERGGPIAGIVLFSDGGSNAGMEYGAAVDVAQDAGISVFTVGLGSNQRPVNVRVVDFEAPSRVYPGDHFTVTGYLQANGLEGRTVKVELFSAPHTGRGQESAEIFEEDQRVRLGKDGEVLPVTFDVAPAQQGRRTYKLRVTPPEQDRDPRDNQQTAHVEIVDRKSRVLLVAGGPTREFRFLRNQLFRDEEVEVDVWLQTSKPGASQEADNVLHQFPSDSQAMFQYDGVVAFDPDWQQLDEAQVQLLDRWVGQQAGGLVLVAGAVNTPRWTSRQRGDLRLETLKALYPVRFYSRASVSLGASNFGSETAWPLEFTEEGLTASFLGLDDTPLLSEQAWASFTGVYGYYLVRGAKPGATVYARFSDPQTAVDQQLPVYLAGHFYGAGRVFYQGSGEMWRLRGVDEKYFEQYYTKLIRFVSQGRLLRDSNRGVLLVDKQRCLLGDTIIVRAALMDAQFQPLRVPEVAASVVEPDGARRPINLRQVQNAAREGMYAGQFSVLTEGDYRIELPIPRATEDILLTREVRARVPDLEIEHPQRNDALLSDIGRRTGGAYYVGMPAVVGRGGMPSLASAIVPQEQQTYLPATPDRDFDQRLMTWLMGLLCGVLCVEWLVRRLNRLA